LPGSGKSAISKILKEDFGHNVIKIEEILEIETGKDLCQLVKNNGFQSVGKMERRIIDRFEKLCGRIIIGCGITTDFSSDKFMIVYLKCPKEKFLEVFKKCSNKENLENHYSAFHKYFSNHADLVISTEHKMKFEISTIINDFYKKNILHKQNT